MKIVKDSQTRVYELTYLVSTTLTADEAKQVVEAVSKLITKYKGEILDSEDWGKKELSYVIKHGGELHREAIYTHLKIELDTSKVQTFEKDVYLMPQLMRHLLVVSQNDAEELEIVKKPAPVKEEKPVVKAKKPVSAEKPVKKDIEDKVENKVENDQDEKEVDVKDKK